MTEPIYRISQLVHRYNQAPALCVDALELDRATITGLIGPNGSGKSTLLNLLAFIDAPTAGEIRYAGRPALPFSPHVRFRVTLLTQEPYLMKRSVFENIAYGLALRKETGELRQRVFDAMDQVGLSPASFARRRWYELSGGEAQRVALAARLILEPEVLLLDEPTASVDAESALRIKAAALHARDRWGTTLVVASHDWQWLYEVCDRVIHLDGGRVFGDGFITVIRGRWTPEEDGRLAFRLGDGQRIVAADSAPSGPAAFVAAEDLRLISGNETDREPFENRLRATVSRLILEKSTGRIVVTALAGGLVLNTKVAPDAARSRDLFPGRSVVVAFSPAAVRWM